MRISIIKYIIGLMCILQILSYPVFATNHIIKFGGTAGFSYSPNDLTVTVGDTVTWQGSFSSHPLSSTSVPAGAAGFAKNSGSSFSYVVQVAGSYEYQCDFHASSANMVGSFNAIVSSVNEQVKSDSPAVFRLYQNYPNPFNPSTRIKFELEKGENVTLEVFNMLGQKVHTILDQQMNPGTHEVQFDAQDLASGFYYYVLTTDNIRAVKQMILLK